MVEETKLNTLTENIKKIDTFLTQRAGTTDQRLMDIEKDIIDIKGKLGSIKDTALDFKQTLNNMEKRMTAIETKIWLWAGGISAIAMLLTYIVKGIGL